MDALKLHIRPKLEEIGAYFSPTLSSMAGEEMFAHVAKHARRTINPPNDTWVAFASNSRGYKMLPQFQIGLWGTHLFVWFAIIYEAPHKAEFGKKLEKQTKKIIQEIPKDFVWSVDHMKPEVLQTRPAHTRGSDKHVCPFTNNQKGRNIMRVPNSKTTSHYHARKTFFGTDSICI